MLCDWPNIFDVEDEHIYFSSLTQIPAIDYSPLARYLCAAYFQHQIRRWVILNLVRRPKYPVGFRRMRLPATSECRASRKHKHTHTSQLHTHTLSISLYHTQTQKLGSARLILGGRSYAHTHTMSTRPTVLMWCYKHNRGGVNAMCDWTLVICGDIRSGKAIDYDGDGKTGHKYISIRDATEELMQISRTEFCVKSTRHDREKNADNSSRASVSEQDGKRRQAQHKTE